MLAFVSPEENSALPMLYVQRIGSSTVTLLPGTQGASYPFWSPDGAYVGFFANGKLQKMAVAGGAPQVLATALGRTRRKLGKQERNHLCSGRAKSAATHQCRWDGNGAGHTEYQDCRGSVPPLAAISSRRRSFLILGRELRKPQGLTARAASTRVLSKARKENLLSSAIRVLVTMRAICFMPTTNDSWSASLLTPQPARFRGAPPWSPMPSDSNPPLTGQHSLWPRTGH